MPPQLRRSPRNALSLQTACAVRYVRICIRGREPKTAGATLTVRVNGELGREASEVADCCVLGPVGDNRLGHPRDAFGVQDLLDDGSLALVLRPLAAGPLFCI